MLINWSKPNEQIITPEESRANAMYISSFYASVSRLIRSTDSVYISVIILSREKVCKGKRIG